MIVAVVEMALPVQGMSMHILMYCYYIVDAKSQVIYYICYAKTNSDQ